MKHLLTVLIKQVSICDLLMQGSANEILQTLSMVLQRAS